VEVAVVDTMTDLRWLSSRSGTLFP
jgi:hypothetical protein